MMFQIYGYIYGDGSKGKLVKIDSNDGIFDSKHDVLTKIIIKVKILTAIIELTKIVHNKNIT